MVANKVLRTAIFFALMAGAVGVSGVRAQGISGCEDRQVYRYCGDYVPASNLPLSFSYNASGAPALGCAVNVVVCGAEGVQTAIKSAMTQWNAAWPGTKACAPLCWNGGPNTISWGDLGSGGPVAVADLTFDGAQRIARVNIILNNARPWRIAVGKDLATGAASAATAEAFGTGVLGTWYDVETVLLHEFGHALGLDDIGNAAAPFPFDLGDGSKYPQAMYRWYFRGSVKRTLGAGDVAGLQRVALDSYLRG